MFIITVQNDFRNNGCFKRVNQNFGGIHNSTALQAPQSSPNDTLELFYVNDWHRKFSPLYALSKKIEEFDNEKTGADKLKIAAGDLVIGENQTINKFFFKFFGSNGKNNNKPACLGFDVMCLGNHEFDPGEDALAKELDGDTYPTYPFVATNLTIKNDSPLARHKDKKIVKSYIKEINGTKYGFVGLVPTTLNGGKYSATFFPGLYISDQRVDDNNNYIGHLDKDKMPCIYLKADIEEWFAKVDNLFKEPDMNERKAKLYKIFDNISKIYEKTKSNANFKEQNAVFKEIEQIAKQKKDILDKQTNHRGKKEQIELVVGLLRQKLKQLDKINQNKLMEADLKETAEVLDKEIKNLESQGINRIICVSHMGIDENDILAKKVSGIDIIVSGHKHDLFNRPKIKYHNRETSNGKVEEPTIIVQAGRNGENYGKLKVKFDEKGIIDKDSVSNEIDKNWLEDIYSEIKRFYDGIDNQIYGEEALQLGNLAKPYYPITNKIQENPAASLIADAVRFETNADAVMLINQYDYRTFGLDIGPITERDIEDLATYDDALYKVKLTGNQIKSILAWGIDSLGTNGYGKKKSGTVQVSGLKYTISPKEVSNVFITSGGIEKPIYNNRTYNVVISSYLPKRAVATEKKEIYDLIHLNNPEELPYRTKFAIVDYMFKNKDKFNQFTLEPSGRINVVDYKINGKSDCRD